MGNSNSGNSGSENNPSGHSPVIKIPAVPFWIAFGILGLLLIVGIILIISRPPSGHPVILRPPPVLSTPTPALLVVQVAGAVSQPGVYEIPAGGRLRDAIQAAGGLLPEADIQALNLAAPLVDGIRLVIPTIQSNSAIAITGRSDTLDLGSDLNTSTLMPVFGSPTPGGLVNINTASLDELDSLPGVGEVIAQRIIDYRNTNGPFATIEDIQKVSGIGPAKYEALKDLITVGP